MARCRKYSEEVEKCGAVAAACNVKYSSEVILQLYKMRIKT